MGFDRHVCQRPNNKAFTICKAFVVVQYHKMFTIKQISRVYTTIRARQPTSLAPTLGLYQPRALRAVAPTPPTRTEGVVDFERGYLCPPLPTVAGGAPRVWHTSPHVGLYVTPSRLATPAPRRRTRPQCVRFRLECRKVGSYSLRCSLQKRSELGSGIDMKLIRVLSPDAPSTFDHMIKCNVVVYKRYGPKQSVICRFCVQCVAAALLLCSIE